MVNTLPPPPSQVAASRYCCTPHRESDPTSSTASPTSNIFPRDQSSCTKFRHRHPLLPHLRKQLPFVVGLLPDLPHRLGLTPQPQPRWQSPLQMLLQLMARFKSRRSRTHKTQARGPDKFAYRHPRRTLSRARLRTNRLPRPPRPQLLQQQRLLTIGPILPLARVMDSQEETHREGGFVRQAHGVLLLDLRPEPA